MCMEPHFFGGGTILYHFWWRIVDAFSCWALPRHFALETALNETQPIRPIYRGSGPPEVWALSASISGFFLRRPYMYSENGNDANSRARWVDRWPAIAGVLPATISRPISHNGTTETRARKDKFLCVDRHSTAAR